LQTICLWVPFFMAFGLLAFTTIWTPALLQQGGMSASATGMVVGLGGFGALLGMATAGRLIDRFGALRVLTPAFILGAAAVAALGVEAPSVAYAATVLGLSGIFIGGGASGAIALAALTYPTAIRSTGIGWAMGMGRLGQVVSPLVAGAMLAAGFGGGQIMPSMAIAALVAAGFVVLLGLAGRRSATAALATPNPLPNR
jgi:AAHS family 4-hydroxybenzoate transporter-like MFS transporter